MFYIIGASHNAFTSFLNQTSGESSNAKDTKDGEMGNPTEVRIRSSYLNLFTHINSLVRNGKTNGKKDFSKS